MYNNFNMEMASAFSAMAGMFIFIGIISLAVTVLAVVALWKMFEKAGEPGWAALIPFYNSYVLFRISWGNGWFFLLSVVPAILYEVVYIIFFAGFIKGFTDGMMNNGMGNSFDDAYIASMVSNTVGMGLIMFVLWAGMLAVNIILCIKLAKVFGQGGGFACGLFFLGVIFYCIIAFSKNIRYVGLQGNIPPYGAGGGQPGQFYGYAQQGYQNPYYQPNGYQQGYQNPYYQPNAYQPPNVQPSTSNPEGFNQHSSTPSVNMFCSECGTRLENGEKVCPNCGKNL